MYPITIPKHKNNHGFWIYLATLLTLAVLPATAWCASVELTWDPPQEASSVEGYNIYHALSDDHYSSQPSKSVQGSQTTNSSVSGLSEEETYKFVATSYTAEGEESGYSNEVLHYVSASSSNEDTEESEEELVYALNSGGSEYTTASGLTFRSDENYQSGSQASTSAGIADTEEDPIYQSERYGDFSYNIPLQDGDYQVTLLFAEIYWTDPEQRVFDVNIEGQERISDLDLVAKVGSETAYQTTVPATVSDGELNLEFSTEVNNATLSGLKIMQ